MKKMIALIVAACLIFCGIVGYLSYREKNRESAPAEAADRVEPEEQAELTGEQSAETDAPEEQAVQIRQLDYDALYRTHDPDEVVATIDGRDVTWELYFYMLYYQAQSTQSYFDMLSYYGMAEDWADPVEEGGRTYAEDAVSSAEAMLVQLLAIEGYEAANNVALTEEDLAALETQKQAEIAELVGEDGTEEDFRAYLADYYMSEALYDRINAVNTLYQQGYIQIYGSNGEKVSDEEALAYLEENEYMAANHILFMTIDPSSYESLDEEMVTAKLAQAQAVAEELQAIEDQEALLLRFAELKEEYDEDSGKEAYPNGYTFTPGTMVTEFEDTVLTLAPYQVSDPVESVYGYHVILRLPLNVDEIVAYSSSGTELSARSLVANTAYGEGIQTYLDALEIEYAEGFAIPNLLDYVK